MLKNKFKFFGIKGKFMWNVNVTFIAENSINSLKEFMEKWEPKNGYQIEYDLFYDCQCDLLSYIFLGYECKSTHEKKIFLANLKYFLKF